MLANIYATALPVLLTVIQVPVSEQVGVRLLGENNSTRGELQLLDATDWTTICSGALDPIEAQIACRELGFPFFLQIGTVNEPAPDDNFFSITHVDCNTNVEKTNTSPADLRLEICNYELIFGDCSTSVYLECGNEPPADTDHGLVVFTERQHFWLFTPNISTVIECFSVELYCEPLFWVPLTAPFFMTSKHVCDKIDVTTSLGVQCLPGERDVCLETEEGDCTAEGVVRYVKDQKTLSVCAASFGFLEAYVVCSQIGLSKISSLSYMPLDEDCDTFTISANCTGNEDNFTQCHLDTATDCPDIAYLVCDKRAENASVLVGVSCDSFSVISPEDGVYVDDCQATRPLHCPGAYYLERTLPTIQDIVTQLTNSQSCSELGPIDLPIPCPVMSPCSSGNMLVAGVEVTLMLVMVAVFT